MNYLCRRLYRIRQTMITRIFRSSAIVLLMMVFLAGSTGLSFYIHTCGSTHNTKVYLFKEIFSKRMSCCCDEDLSGNATNNRSLTYQDENCCRISHLFIKAPLAGFPVLEKISLRSLPVAELHESPYLQLQPVRDAEIILHSYICHSPPPFFGVTLIYYIHQIRIPAPVC